MEAVAALLTALLLFLLSGLLQRLVFGAHEAFLVLPELSAYYMRIVVPLLRPDPAMKGFGRVKQLPVILLKAVVLAPLCQLLWLLDEVLYPGYRRVELQSPVFVLAPPRTGSTSLHRALCADSDRFFAPQLVELFFPFITVSKALHAVHDRPALMAPLMRFIHWFVALCGIRPSETSRRHPMGLFKEDEDDIALTVHHLTSEISWCAISHIENFLWGAHIHKRSAETQRRTALFLTRAYQKIAFSRGRGRTLCTKSHLVGLAPQLRLLHPTARFVTIVRPIQGIFPSFWSLQCAISRDFGRIDSTGREYRDMRVTFLREIHAELCRVFGDGVTSPSFRVLTFPNFVADPVGQVAALYAVWGLRGVTRARLEALIEPYLGGEEHVHALGNATWADMGIKEEEIAQLVRCPMLTYGHLNLDRGEAPAGAGGRGRGHGSGAARLRSASPPGMRSATRVRAAKPA